MAGELERKRKKLEKLRETECAKCAKSKDPNDMWCWNLPWTECHVKTLREEIEGPCENPLSAKEYIGDLMCSRL